MPKNDVAAITQNPKEDAISKINPILYFPLNSGHINGSKNTDAHLNKPKRSCFF